VTGPPLAQYCLRRRWAQVAVERLLGWGPAGGARRLEQAGRPADAEKALGLPPERTELWPHVQVRVDLAFGAALAALSRTDEAQRSLQRALAISEANGLRTFQLAAHRALIGVVEDAAAKDRHVRIAHGLARSLAANLPKEEAARFLAWHGLED
jgi:hypothetical protein